MDSDDDHALSQALDKAEEEIRLSQDIPDKQVHVGSLVTDDFVAALPKHNVPINTRKRQNWAAKTFYEWRNSRNKFVSENQHKDISWQVLPDTPLEKMTTDDINNCCPKFILEARKQYGGAYPPDTLHQLFMGLQGKMRLKGNHFTLLHDVIFKPVREALDYRMKLSTEMGLGHKKQAQPISVSLEDKMWEENVLGDDTPSKLLHTLMYLVGTNFALRASDHKALNIDDQLQVII